MRSLRAAPVQSPKSHSRIPGSVRTSSPRAAAMGAAVSRVRSSGEAYTAWMRVGSDHAFSRSATVAACRAPVSDRCSPPARPGRTLPVVGVAPWRTSRTSVGDGGAGLDFGGRVTAFLADVVGIAPAQPSVWPVPSGRAHPDLAALAAEIVDCRACPRLVAWREQVAGDRRAAFRGEEYWG